MTEINFTEEQKNILNLFRGEHLVLAPPGTGKTELLSERVVQALDRNVKQERMICLTFTNRASENMVERVLKKIGNNNIFIGNIHRWCSQFLFSNNIVPKNTSLLDEEDSLQIVDEIKELLRIRSRHRSEFIKANTYIKQQNLKFPKELLIPFNIENENIKYLNEFHFQYEKIKKESLYIDFDDLLTLSCRILQNKRNYISYSWLQVDEVQDLNPIQWFIIDLITNKDSHKVFFGDYEQAIFSFMGAKLNSLKAIEEKGAKIHFLSENFRSSECFIKLFNAYAKLWLKPTWVKEPVASSLGGSLQIRRIKGCQYTEAQWIVNRKLPNEPKDPTAILVRTNNVADMYAKELDKKNIKYFKVSGFDLFRRKEVKDLFSFFLTLINNEDRISWSRVLSLYGGLDNLKTSRHLINSMFEIGLRPTDFIGLYPDSLNLLDFFQDVISNRRVVVFDTETTGLDIENDDIIQIAAVEIVKGVVCQEFVVYINTEKDLTSSEKIHHISKKFLNENSIDRYEALLSFKKFIKGDMLIAHNVQYDKEILFYNFKREGLEFFSEQVYFIDSIDLTKRVYLDLFSYKLEFLLRYFNIEGVNSHNAIDDVHATANLLFFLKSQILVKQEARCDFVKSNFVLLSKFKISYLPLYTAISSKFSNEMPLDEIILIVIGYMESFGVDVDEELYREIDKILNFMRNKCNLDKVLSNIKKYIPEFTKYAEVDLIIGNEKIFIATIHKAKGLEFNNVIIPQVVDGTFPFYQSKSGEKIREDARLLYVAMTRAKSNLLITCPNFIIVKSDDKSYIFNRNLSYFISDPLIIRYFSDKEIGV